ncbi:hypothetical protein [Terrilactibacillus laevilacticus]|uniref:hypothetical protein n=1 Tax=Terrilactibacillus laevilacticus TaxID=1380157 RepID=UPI001146B5D5|nr:hypothetical protein [Terrilactibacillus laevilacticus]
MLQDTLYFSDNFFSAGRTDIFNESKETVGILDLKSAFSSGVNVLNPEGEILTSGKFPFMGIKWRIYDDLGEEIGALKGRFAFFSKKYEYDAYGRGIFQVEAEAFSKQYVILKEQSVVAEFNKISGFFSSPAYQLKNLTDDLLSEELVAVVMGINAIEKRRRNNAANSGAT